ncbi:hypothetical protein, partial [Staphylococcus auricularis]|uniref:hypothetical protein n=1 Tax=Staphylococcus auricularis TaxID=29379 RepID=UPI001248BB17
MAVVAEKLREGFMKMKEIGEIERNRLSELMMERFIERGVYDRDKNKVMWKHGEKVKILEEGLKGYFDDYEYKDKNKLERVIKLGKGMNMSGLYGDFEKLGMGV